MSNCLIALAKFVGKQTDEIEEVVEAFFKKNRKYRVDVNLINVTIKNIVHLDSSEETPEQIQLHYRVYISIIKTTIECIKPDERNNIHFNKLINHLSANAHCEIWLLDILKLLEKYLIKIEAKYDNGKLVNLYTIMDNHSSSKSLDSIIQKYLSVSIMSLNYSFVEKIGIFLANIFELFVANRFSSTQILDFFKNIFTQVYEKNISRTQTFNILYIFVRTFGSLINIIATAEIKKREVCKNGIYIDTLKCISNILIKLNTKFDEDINIEDINIEDINIEDINIEDIYIEDINIEIAKIIKHTIDIAQYYRVVFKVCNNTYIQYQDVVSLLFSLIKFDFRKDLMVSTDLVVCYDQVLQFLKRNYMQQLIPHPNFTEVLQGSMNYIYDDIFYLIDYYLIVKQSDKFCIYMNNILTKIDDIAVGVKYVTLLLESKMNYWKRCDNFYKVANYVRHKLSSHTYLHSIYKILLKNFKKYKTNRKYLADILYIMSTYIHTTCPFSVEELKVFKQNLPFIKKTIISYSESTPKEILYKHHLKKQYKYLNKKVNIMYWRKMSDNMLKT